GQKIRFTKLIPDTDKYTYKNAETSQSQTIPADNVLRIEEQTGTEAGKWALIMGASGLLGSVLGVLSVKNNPNLEIDDSKIAPVVIGLTAASALIGLAIGAGKKKYKTVYTNSKYDTSYRVAPLRINLTCSPKQGVGVALRYRL
ncbi:MAG: hypothetical protein L6Q97_06985, partial [Thermoanaerobaculia bacterium]|nr:hypothetical protein [Thermoanaerobaculia bacterium]